MVQTGFLGLRAGRNLTGRGGEGHSRAELWHVQMKDHAGPGAPRRAGLTGGAALRRGAIVASGCPAEDLLGTKPAHLAALGQGAGREVREQPVVACKTPITWYLSQYSYQDT